MPTRQASFDKYAFKRGGNDCGVWLYDGDSGAPIAPPSHDTTRSVSPSPICGYNPPASRTSSPLRRCMPYRLPQAMFLSWPPGRDKLLCRAAFCDGGFRMPMRASATSFARPCSRTNLGHLRSRSIRGLRVWSASTVRFSRGSLCGHATGRAPEARMRWSVGCACRSASVQQARAVLHAGLYTAAAATAPWVGALMAPGPCTRRRTPLSRGCARPFPAGNTASQRPRAGPQGQLSSAMAPNTPQERRALAMLHFLLKTPCTNTETEWRHT